MNPDSVRGDTLPIVIFSFVLPDCIGVKIGKNPSKMRKNRDFGGLNCIGICNTERGAAGHTAFLYREAQSGGRGVCLKVQGTFDALFSRRVGAGQGPGGAPWRLDLGTGFPDLADFGKAPQSAAAAVTLAQIKVF